MNRDEALKEARRRWGPEGAVWLRAAFMGARIPSVGTVHRWTEKDWRWQSKGTRDMRRSRRCYKGEGETWEAAFAAADRREGPR